MKTLFQTPSRMAMMSSAEIAMNSSIPLIALDVVIHLGNEEIPRVIGPQVRVR